MARQQWHITVRNLTTAIVLSVLLLLGVAAVLVFERGLSAREQPTLTEEIIARSVRHVAMPASMRNVRNPIPMTSDVLADARAHWVDHCANCHGNDGRGQTDIGRNLYPKAPDMRSERTQDLTDGELFSIIKNGIRLTGMPAWGDPAGRDDADNWKLVHFIRHVPKIGPQELEEMKSDESGESDGARGRKTGEGIPRKRSVAGAASPLTRECMKAARGSRLRNQTCEHAGASPAYSLLIQLHLHAGVAAPHPSTSNDAERSARESRPSQRSAKLFMFGRQHRDGSSRR